MQIRKLFQPVVDHNNVSNVSIMAVCLHVGCVLCTRGNCVHTQANSDPACTPFNTQSVFQSSDPASNSKFSFYPGLGSSEPNGLFRISRRGTSAEDARFEGRRGEGCEMGMPPPTGRVICPSQNLFLILCSKSAIFVQFFAFKQNGKGGMATCPLNTPLPEPVATYATCTVYGLCVIGFTTHSANHSTEKTKQLWMPHD